MEPLVDVADERVDLAVARAAAEAASACVERLLELAGRGQRPCEAEPGARRARGSMASARSVLDVRFIEQARRPERVAESARPRRPRPRLPSAPPLPGVRE